VVGIDPETNAAVGRPLRVPVNAEAIAVGQGTLWAASVGPWDLGRAGEDQVTRIDLATGRSVATITVGRAPLDLAVTPGAVWVTNSGGGGDSVARIDPATNRLAGRRVTTSAGPDRPGDQPAGGPPGHHQRQPPEPGLRWWVGVGGQP
jgi:DNA-binding beta-propeller fold protein YncE